MLQTFVVGSKLKFENTRLVVESAEVSGVIRVNLVQTFPKKTNAREQKPGFVHETVGTRNCCWKETGAVKWVSRNPGARFLLRKSYTNSLKL